MGGQEKEASQKEKRRDKKTWKKKRGGRRGGHPSAETVPTLKTKTGGIVEADISSAKGEEIKGSIVGNVGTEEVKDQKVNQKGRKRKREDNSEVEIDIYKIHYASDSYPEGDGDGDEESSKEQSHVEEKERINSNLREIRDCSATRKGEQLSQLDPQIETDGGAVSTGLLELEKLLGAATQATPLQKSDVLPQERGSDRVEKGAEAIINDRLFDSDSNASDSEGGLHMRDEDSSDISMSLDSSSGDASNDGSEGSSNDSDLEQDSDSNEEVTEEVTAKEPSQGVPPLPTNQVPMNPANASNSRNRNSIQKQKNTCKSFMRTGTCKYGSNCRYSHTRITMPTSASKPPQALAEEQVNRISLYERLLQKEREKENEIVVRAVTWLFREGVLQKPENAEELEKEQHQSEEKPREGKRGSKRRPGPGWRHGGRGRVGGRRRGGGGGGGPGGGGGGGGGGKVRGVGGGGRRGRSG